MFNRHLEIKMVKKDKKETTPANQNDMTIEGKVAHISYCFDRLITKAARVALAYVVLDIGRQVVIAMIDQPK